jgi:hypothetical protein
MSENTATAAVLEGVQKLSRDLRAAAKLMSPREARYFVNSYYDLQDYRIAAANQQRKLGEGEEPSEFMTWFNANLDVFEQQLKTMLDKWSAAQPMGAWAREIVGIGPVISAGLLANIDITKAPTVGHIWRYAGLDPTVKWERHGIRPWNASLKRLCWLMGESFVKVSGREKDVYGKLYLQRKAYEAANNDSGKLAPVAEKRLVEDKGKKLDADLRALFAEGRLPAKALHERAKRWAVKQFLSDWHAEAYRKHYRTEPPFPYPIAHLGHAHLRRPAER